MIADIVIALIFTWVGYLLRIIVVNHKTATKNENDQYDKMMGDMKDRAIMREARRIRLKECDKAFEDYLKSFNGQKIIGYRASTGAILNYELSIEELKELWRTAWMQEGVKNETQRRS